MTIGSYVQLLKLRIGFMIALTALAGYAAVAHSMDGTRMALLALAMLLGSASSSVFNHFYDRDIDRLMKRTQGRPLASGAMANPHIALWLSGALLLAGLSLAAGIFNWMVAGHLFLGAFVYGVVYTVWLKRRTWMNIVIGGAAGSFAVMGGAAAVAPGEWLLPTLMAITLFLWTPSHFWALAILLKEDYASAGVPMLPVLVGDAKCARVIFANALLLVASTLLPPALGLQGPLYAVIAALAGGRFLWFCWLLLREPGPVRARRAFFGSMEHLTLVFLATVLDKHLPVAAWSHAVMGWLA